MIIRNKPTKNFEDNYFTHNRKLKLEEYDDDGKLIDVIEFSQGDLWQFYILKNNSCSDLTIARKKDREHFTGKKLELVKKLLYLYNEEFFNEDTLSDIEDLFNTYTFEELEFALTFKNDFNNEAGFSFSLHDYWRMRQMKFIDTLKWIKNSDGMYYAVANDGIKGMSYFEQPTRKQAKYQRVKNGKRIIFLNFRDWKEYSVNENELHS